MGFHRRPQADTPRRRVALPWTAAACIASLVGVLGWLGRANVRAREALGERDLAFGSEPRSDGLRGPEELRVLEDSALAELSTGDARQVVPLDTPAHPQGEHRSEGPLSDDVLAPQATTEDAFATAVSARFDVLHGRFHRLLALESHGARIVPMGEPVWPAVSSKPADPRKRASSARTVMLDERTYETHVLDFAFEDDPWLAPMWRERCAKQ